MNQNTPPPPRPTSPIVVKIDFHLSVIDCLFLFVMLLYIIDYLLYGNVRTCYSFVNTMRLYSDYISVIISVMFFFTFNVYENMFYCFLSDFACLLILLRLIMIAM